MNTLVKSEFVGIEKMNVGIYLIVSCENEIQRIRIRIDHNTIRSTLEKFKTNEQKECYFCAGMIDVSFYKKSDYIIINYDGEHRFIGKYYMDETIIDSILNSL